jgi:hypothetical protein
LKRALVACTFVASALQESIACDAWTHQRDVALAADRSTIGPGRRPEVVPEQSRHVLLIGEAAGERDIRNAITGLAQQPRRALDPEPHEVLMR